MKPKTFGTLLFRILGVLMLLLGVVPLIGTAIAYVSLSKPGQASDVYFVLNQTLYWSVFFVALGAVFLFFSRSFGRLLARGLD